MIYEGWFSKGMQEGFGRLIKYNGGVYIGLWKDGLFHGEGVFYNVEGNEFSGPFLAGSFKGTFY